MNDGSPRIYQPTLEQLAAERQRIESEMSATARPASKRRGIYKSVVPPRVRISEMWEPGNMMAIELVTNPVAEEIRYVSFYEVKRGRLASCEASV